jgi:hypothetical protein
LNKLGYSPVSKAALAGTGVGGASVGGTVGVTGATVGVEGTPQEVSIIVINSKPARKRRDTDKFSLPKISIRDEYFAPCYEGGSKPRKYLRGKAI